MLSRLARPCKWWGLARSNRLALLAFVEYFQLRLRLRARRLGFWFSESDFRLSLFLVAQRSAGIVAGCPEGVLALGAAGEDARRTAAGTAALQSPLGDLGHYPLERCLAFNLALFSLFRRGWCAAVFGFAVASREHF